MNDLSLAYQGVVKVERYKKGKLKKVKYLRNSGTYRLFCILCNYLADGYDVDWNPTYLDIIYRSGNTATSVLNSQPRLTVTGPGAPTVMSSETSTTSCSVSFQATLTNAYVGNTSGASGNLYFALRDNTSSTPEERNILAYVETENWEAGWSISPDDVYIITWQLTLMNSTTESSSATVRTTAEASAASTTSKKSRMVTKNAQ